MPDCVMKPNELGKAAADQAFYYSQKLDSKLSACFSLYHFSKAFTSLPTAFTKSKQAYKKTAQLNDDSCPFFTCCRKKRNFTLANR